MRLRACRGTFVLLMLLGVTSEAAATRPAATPHARVPSVCPRLAGAGSEGGPTLKPPSGSTTVPLTPADGEARRCQSFASEGMDVKNVYAVDLTGDGQRDRLVFCDNHAHVFASAEENSGGFVLVADPSTGGYRKAPIVNGAGRDAFFGYKWSTPIAYRSGGRVYVAIVSYQRGGSSVSVISQVGPERFRQNACGR
jgi:hypothetical protein